MIDFNPAEDILSRSNWPTQKKRDALIALYEGCIDIIDPDECGGTIFLKKGERIHLDPPPIFEDGTNLTFDERCRSRGICPFEGERDKLWFEQIFFKFAKTLWPH